MSSKQSEILQKALFKRLANGVQTNELLHELTTRFDLTEAQRVVNLAIAQY